METERVVQAREKLAEYSLGTTWFFHADHLGSPKVKTAVNGMEAERWDHYPYGETWVPGVPGDQHRYTGHLRDAESENDYAGARYYANQRGRWLSVDPVMGDRSNPQRLNRYAYVLGDPVNFVDPNGADPLQITCRGAFFVDGSEQAFLGSFEVCTGSYTRSGTDRGGGLSFQEENRAMGKPQLDTLGMQFTRCQKKAFGNGVAILGGRPLPSFAVTGLILAASRQSGVAAALIAAVWAVESNYRLDVPNRLNKNGSVDIGPLQINYHFWTASETNTSVINRFHSSDEIFGTNLGGTDKFNGDTWANLLASTAVHLHNASWMKDPTDKNLFIQYNAGDATNRGRIWDEMSMPLEEFFDCIDQK